MAHPVLPVPSLFLRLAVLSSSHTGLLSAPSGRALSRFAHAILTARNIYLLSLPSYMYVTTSKKPSLMVPMEQASLTMTQSRSILEVSFQSAHLQQSALCLLWIAAP